jgi:hypothetical protein
VLKKIITKHKTILLFLGVSFLITSVLMRGGNILGGGEAGAPFYNLPKMASISSSTWVDMFLGFPSGTNFASVTFFGLLALLNSVGFSGYFLQFLFFMGVMFTGFYSVYLLAKEVFPESKVWALYLVALFYQFNLFTIVNIWNRFILNALLFYSILPLVLLIVIRGLSKKNRIYAIYLAILAAFCSYALTAPAQVVIFFAIVFFTIVYFQIAVNRDIRFNVSFFATFVVSFILFNFWWLSGNFIYITSSGYTAVADSFFTPYGNYNAFIALSNSLGGLSGVLLFKHATFFTRSTGYPGDWPLVYSSSVVLAMSWALFIFVIVGIVNNIKNKWIMFFSLLLLMGIFTAKGASAPFGEIFSFVFRKVSFLGFFRNPFEKLGILLPLAFTPLLAFSLNSFVSSKKINSTLRFTGALFLSFYIVLILGFPFWTGLIFTSGNPPANDPNVGIQVKVPDYYRQADNWLTGQGGDYRYVAFPLGGEGIFYNWEKGYVGVEQSGILFSNNGISHSTTIPYYSSISQELPMLLGKYRDFPKITALLNAKYLIFRPDIDAKRSQAIDPQVVLQKIDTLRQEGYFNDSYDFGPLRIFEYKDEYVTPKIYPARQLVATNEPGTLESLFFADFDDSDVLVSTDISNEFPEKARILYPSARFQNREAHNYNNFSDPRLFPYVGRTASSKAYSLVLLREKISEVGYLKSEDLLDYRIKLWGKRLVETDMALVQGDIDAAGKSLDLYEMQVEGVINVVQGNSSNLRKRNGIFRVDFLEHTFGTHLEYLYHLAEKYPNTDTSERMIGIAEKLNNHSKNLFIFPYYGLVANDTFPIQNRLTYQFAAGVEGEYEFMVPEIDWDSYFGTPSSMEIQIDDKIVSVSLQVVEGKGVSFGNIEFGEGIHAISFNLPERKNLLDVEDNYTMSVDHGNTSEEFPFVSFDPYASYVFSLEYDVRRGSAPVLALAQDSDPEANGSFVHTYERQLPYDDYWFEPRSLEVFLAPSSWSTNASLKLVLSSANDCTKLTGYDPRKCEDEVFKQQFDRASETMLSNMSLYKETIETPYLIHLNEVASSNDLPEVGFTKNSHVSYDVEISDNKSPFLLVFSESYDPGWILYKNGEEYASNRHYLVNAYANAWVVDENENGSFQLRYVPEKTFRIASLLSVVSIAVGIVGIFLYRKNAKK